MLAPSVDQYRNVHDYLKDFIDEEDLYKVRNQKIKHNLIKDAGRFVKFLTQWNCIFGSTTTLFDCIQQLNENLVIQQFWKTQDAKLTAAWLADLISVGYIPPKLNFLYSPIKSQQFKLTLEQHPTIYLKSNVKHKV